MINPDVLKTYLREIEALGMAPSVLVKAIEMAQDPGTDMETFSNLLRNDGALAADIIRISNSPYYAPVEPHSNLMSAISQLGFGEIIHVVNLSLAKQLFARDLLSYGIAAHDYWCDSISTALIMEALAKPAGQDPEDAYTLGILHAIGRVLINSAIEDKGLSIFWNCQQPIEEWERESIGYDFAEAGAMLLAHWKFPPQTCEAIRDQLQPLGAEQLISPAGALQCSRRLLAAIGLAFQNPVLPEPDFDPFLKALAFTPESLSQLVAECQEKFQKVRHTVDWS
jgi:HD-like signal output (HDOD) protein